MSNPEYIAALKAALAEAKRHSANRLPELVSSYNFEVISRGTKHYAVHCPFCRGKQKFIMRDDPEGWTYRCFKTTCDANRQGDAISFITLHTGCDNRTACRIIIERAGLEHPYDRFLREQKNQRNGNP